MRRKAGGGAYERNMGMRSNMMTTRTFACYRPINRLRIFRIFRIGASTVHMRFERVEVSKS